MFFKKYLCYTSKGFLTFRKILRRGADGFTSSSEEGLLRILPPLKNVSIQWQAR
jgi:hypothetical protein